MIDGEIVSDVWQIMNVRGHERLFLFDLVQLMGTTSVLGGERVVMLRHMRHLDEDLEKSLEYLDWTCLVRWRGWST